jgi:predicted PurR-regulated permease PerM
MSEKLLWVILMAIFTAMAGAVMYRTGALVAAVFFGLMIGLVMDDIRRYLDAKLVKQGVYIDEDNVRYRLVRDDEE